MQTIFLALAAAAAIAAAPAGAATITDGTVNSAFLFAPTIALSDAESAFSVAKGSTFQVVSTGAFAAAAGLTGTMDGAVRFSKTVGTAIDQTLTNLFQFGDGHGGQFDFSAFRAVTTAFADRSDVSTSGSLVLYGFTSNPLRAQDATASTLTITFNATGNSAFSGSATLATTSAAPAPTIAAVPEPTTWAMMLVGLGMVAGAARYRRRSLTARLA